MQGEYQCVELRVSRPSRGRNEPNPRLARSPTLHYDTGRMKGGLVARRQALRCEGSRIVEKACLKELTHFC